MTIDFAWLKTRPKISEVLPDTSLEQLLPSLGPALEAIKGTTSTKDAKRFFSYAQLEGESISDFNLRKILDIATGFYKLKNQYIQSPISIDSEVPRISGLLLELASSNSNYINLSIILDFPSFFIETLDPSLCYGCRMAILGNMDPFTGRVLIPNIPQDLKDFFNVLPRNCSFQAWEKLETADPTSIIFQSFLVAPADLLAHFSADSLIRLLALLSESYTYQCISRP